MDLLFEELTYTIRGSVFRVYNTLGFGHKELVYHKALSIQFVKDHIPFTEEVSIPVLYDNAQVGTYKPDFIIDRKVIIEIKALPFLPKEADAQLVYYLKGTNFPLGLLINFGGKRLEIKRMIWTARSA